MNEYGESALWFGLTPGWVVFLSCLLFCAAAGIVSWFRRERPADGISKPEREDDGDDDESGFDPWYPCELDGFEHLGASRLLRVSTALAAAVAQREGTARDMQSVRSIVSAARDLIEEVDRQESEQEQGK